MQMHQLGSRMRKEYRGLLHHNGNGAMGLKKALVRSSFLDRTKTSAQLFSQSFFKTNDTVPVTVIPFTEDNVSNF